MTNMTTLIKSLTQIPGISGAESPIAQELHKYIQPYCDLCEIDRFGNVTGFIRSANPHAKTLMLEAHMDQIGMMVSEIQSDGLVSFVNLGGIDPRILPGAEVLIFGKKEIYGIVQLPEPWQDKTTNPALDKYRINVGMSQSQAKAMISVGDSICFHAPTMQLSEDVLCGPSMDNRTGVAAVLDCIERIAGRELPFHISILFSTQEELGLHGAFTGGAALMPDLAIAVDVTHGWTPDTQGETGVFKLGSGAIICRGPNFDDSYAKQLLYLAEEKHVSHEIEVASGGSGTTAWAIQTLGSGVPVMLISIPLRYMHTNVETVSVSDIQSVSDLLYYAATGGIKYVERIV